MDILVTGGSSDIGQAIIKNSLHKGHRVVFTVTKEASLEKIDPELREKSSWLILDLNQPEEFFPAITEKFSNGFDAIVLNAASNTGHYRLLHEYSEDEVKATLNANILGYTRLLQLCLKDMTARQRGKIVLISSLAVNGFYKHSLYGGWKSYLEGLIKAIAIDYGQQGITANIVRPGIVETRKTAKFWKYSHYRKTMQPLIPSGQFGKPIHIASAVDYFLSENCFSNGATLEVTGGLPQIRSDLLLPKLF